MQTLVDEYNKLHKVVIVRPLGEARLEKSGGDESCEQGPRLHREVVALGLDVWHAGTKQSGNGVARFGTRSADGLPNRLTQRIRLRSAVKTLVLSCSLLNQGGNDVSKHQMHEVVRERVGKEQAQKLRKRGYALDAGGLCAALHFCIRGGR